MKKLSVFISALLAHTMVFANEACNNQPQDPTFLYWFLGVVGVVLFIVVFVYPDSN